jgi:hypothetical protein
MIEAKPETFKAELGDLRSLATALTGYTLSVDHPAMKSAVLRNIH